MSSQKRLARQHPFDVEAGQKLGARAAALALEGTLER